MQKDYPKVKPFSIPTPRGKEQVDVKNIIRIQAFSNYTILFFNKGCTATDGKTTWMLARALKWVEDKLPAQQFIRTHRTHLVNKEYLQPLNEHTTSFLLLQNGDSIAISKRKKNGVLKELLNDKYACSVQGPGF